MIITLCGSLKFFDKMLDIRVQLENMGHTVLMPTKVPGVDYWSIDNANRIEEKKKGGFIRGHARKIDLADAVLVVNVTKGDTQYYVGANAFSELIYAHITDKQIYFLNPIPDQPYILDEVRAVESVVLNGDLSKIIEKIKVCDHKSVGILVWNRRKILLIERRRYPFGFAPPAGHLDGDVSYENAAGRELFEEVGLHADKLYFAWDGELQNPCRRPGGSWHFWKVYTAFHSSGEFVHNPLEAKQAQWFVWEDIHRLVDRSNKYLKGEISEEEWQYYPGLELVWLEIFKHMSYIK